MQDNNIGVVLGFDFGMKYIGIATGQTITNTATGLTSIRAVDGIPNWTEIGKLITEWKPDALLVGSPLNMDDTTQHLTHSAHKFANRLKHKFNLPLFLVDERLSTWEAKQRLGVTGESFTNKELNALNAQAAVIIVEQWLNQRSQG